MPMKCDPGLLAIIPRLPMNFFFRCLAWIVVGLLSHGPLAAQDESSSQPGASGEEESAKARGRVAWLVSTSLPDGLENPITVMSGNDLVQVTLSKRSPSEPVKIPDDGIVRVVRKVENPEDPSKPKFLTLAQAQVPEGVNKALIILVPAPANPQGLVFHNRVQDLAKFRGGDYLYINMTNLKVGVDLGKAKVEIKPGEVRIIGAPALSEPVNTPIRYSYLHPEKNKWQTISASVVVLYPSRREICIFSWDPRFNRISYHGITFPVM
jgi:hypothetical protein